MERTSCACTSRSGSQDPRGGRSQAGAGGRRISWPPRRSWPRKTGGKKKVLADLLDLVRRTRGIAAHAAGGSPAVAGPCCAARRCRPRCRSAVS